MPRRRKRLYSSKAKKIQVGGLGFEGDATGHFSVGHATEQKQWSSGETSNGSRAPKSAASVAVSTAARGWNAPGAPKPAASVAVSTAAREWNATATELVDEEVTKKEFILARFEKLRNDLTAKRFLKPTDVEKFLRYTYPRLLEAHPRSFSWCERELASVFDSIYKTFNFMDAIINSYLRTHAIVTVSDIEDYILQQMKWKVYKVNDKRMESGQEAIVLRLVMINITLAHDNTSTNSNNNHKAKNRYFAKLRKFLNCQVEGSELTVLPQKSFRDLKFGSLISHPLIVNVIGEIAATETPQVSAKDVWTALASSIQEERNLYKLDYDEVRNCLREWHMEKGYASLGQMDSQIFSITCVKQAELSARKVKHHDILAKEIKKREKKAKSALDLARNEIEAQLLLCEKSSLTTQMEELKKYISESKDRNRLAATAIQLAGATFRKNKAVFNIVHNVMNNEVKGQLAANLRHTLDQALQRGERLKVSDVLTKMDMKFRKLIMSDPKSEANDTKMPLVFMPNFFEVLAQHKGLRNAIDNGLVVATATSRASGEQDDTASTKDDDANKVLVEESTLVGYIRNALDDTGSNKRILERLVNAQRKVMENLSVKSWSQASDRPFNDLLARNKHILPPIFSDNDAKRGGKEGKDSEKKKGTVATDDSARDSKGQSPSSSSSLFESVEALSEHMAPGKLAAVKFLSKALDDEADEKDNTITSGRAEGLRKFLFMVFKAHQIVARIVQMTVSASTPVSSSSSSSGLDHRRSIEQLRQEIEAEVISMLSHMRECDLRDFSSVAARLLPPRLARFVVHSVIMKIARDNMYDWEHELTTNNTAVVSDEHIVGLTKPATRTAPEVEEKVLPSSSSSSQIPSSTAYAVRKSDSKDGGENQSSDDQAMIDSSEPPPLSARTSSQLRSVTTTDTTKQNRKPRDMEEVEYMFAEIYRKFELLKGESASYINMMLEGMMKRLAEGLYSKSSHFLYEIIQNADDAKYDDPNPRVSICATKDRLRIHINERGFNMADVHALCIMCHSSKKASEGSIGHKGIGFKSVFKITLTPEIHSGLIHFRFNRENNRNDDVFGSSSKSTKRQRLKYCLGYIYPEIISPEEQRQQKQQQRLQQKEDDISGEETKGQKKANEGTVIILPFANEIQTNRGVVLKSEIVAQVSQALDSIKPSLLLFLKKLRHISVEDPEMKVRKTLARGESGPYVFVDVRQQHAIAAAAAAKPVISTSTSVVGSDKKGEGGGDIHEEEGGGDRKSVVDTVSLERYTWLRASHVAPLEGGIGMSSKAKELEVQVAFPLEFSPSSSSLSSPRTNSLHGGEEDVDDEIDWNPDVIPKQDLFAYLPIKNYGFRVVIQADWELTSSREGVHSGDAWNVFIRKQIAPAFRKAALLFISETVKQRSSNSNSGAPPPPTIDDDFKKKLGSATTNIDSKNLSPPPTTFGCGGYNSLLRRFLLCLPLNDDMTDEFFHPVVESVRKEITDLPILMCEGHVLTAPTRVLRGPDDDRLAKATSTILGRVSKFRLLHKSLSKMPLRLQKHLGVREFGAQVVVRILSLISEKALWAKEEDDRDVKEGGEGMEGKTRKMNETQGSMSLRYAWLAWAINCFARDLEKNQARNIEALRKAKVFPLRDGRLVSLDSGRLYQIKTTETTAAGATSSTSTAFSSSDSEGGSLGDGGGEREIDHFSTLARKVLKRDIRVLHPEFVKALIPYQRASDLLVTQGVRPMHGVEFAQSHLIPILAAEHALTEEPDLCISLLVTIKKYTSTRWGIRELSSQLKKNDVYIVDQNERVYRISEAAKLLYFHPQYLDSSSIEFPTIMAGILGVDQVHVISTKYLQQQHTSTYDKPLINSNGNEEKKKKTSSQIVDHNWERRATMKREWRELFTSLGIQSHMRMDAVHHLFEFTNVSDLHHSQPLREALSRKVRFARNIIEGTVMPGIGEILEPALSKFIADEMINNDGAAGESSSSGIAIEIKDYRCPILEKSLMKLEANSKADRRCSKDIASKSSKLLTYFKEALHSVVEIRTEVAKATACTITVCRVTKQTVMQTAEAKKDDEHGDVVRTNLASWRVRSTVSERLQTTRWFNTGKGQLCAPAQLLLVFSISKRHTLRTIPQIRTFARCTHNRNKYNVNIDTYSQLETPEIVNPLGGLRKYAPLLKDDSMPGILNSLLGFRQDLDLHTLCTIFRKAGRSRRSMSMQQSYELLRILVEKKKREEKQQRPYSEVWDPTIPVIFLPDYDIKSSHNVYTIDQSAQQYGRLYSVDECVAHEYSYLVDSTHIRVEHQTRQLAVKLLKKMANPAMHGKGRRPIQGVHFARRRVLDRFYNSFDLFKELRVLKTYRPEFYFALVAKAVRPGPTINRDIVLEIIFRTYKMWKIQYDKLAEEGDEGYEAKQKLLSKSIRKGFSSLKCIPTEGSNEWAAPNDPLLFLGEYTPFYVASPRFQTNVGAFIPTGKEGKKRKVILASAKFSKVENIEEDVWKFYKSVLGIPRLSTSLSVSYKIEDSKINNTECLPIAASLRELSAASWVIATKMHEVAKPQEISSLRSKLSAISIRFAGQMTSTRTLQKDGIVVAEEKQRTISCLAQTPQDDYDGRKAKKKEGLREEKDQKQGGGEVEHLCVLYVSGTTPLNVEKFLEEFGKLLSPVDEPAQILSKEVYTAMSNVLHKLVATNPPPKTQKELKGWLEDACPNPAESWWLPWRPDLIPKIGEKGKKNDSDAMLARSLENDPSVQLFSGQNEDSDDELLQKEPGKEGKGGVQVLSDKERRALAEAVENDAWLNTVQEDLKNRNASRKPSRVSGGGKLSPLFKLHNPPAITGSNQIPRNSNPAAITGSSQIPRNSMRPPNNQRTASTIRSTTVGSTRGGPSERAYVPRSFKELAQGCELSEEQAAQSLPSTNSVRHDVLEEVDMKKDNRKELMLPKSLFQLLHQSGGNVSENMRLGRWGEERVYHHLVRELRSSAAQVSWMNEEKEKGTPYDILVKCASGKRYVEVKTTRMKGSTLVPLSLREVLFAYECIKRGESYDIYFVQLESVRGAPAKISRIKDPLSAIGHGINLMLSIPRLGGRQAEG
eukprot:jgi/Bigna1/85631/estExt_fgenesh1_pg.C_50090